MSVTTDREAESHAGWYPDPARSTLLRYWDGRAWTDKLEHPSAMTEPHFDYASDGSLLRIHQYG